MSKTMEMRHTCCLCQKSSKNMDSQLVELCRFSVPILHLSGSHTKRSPYIYVYGNIFFPSDVDKEWKECEYFS